jgi:hypothetical protein
MIASSCGSSAKPHYTFHVSALKLWIYKYCILVAFFKQNPNLRGCNVYNKIFLCGTTVNNLTTNSTIIEFTGVCQHSELLHVCSLRVFKCMYNVWTNKDSTVCLCSCVRGYCTLQADILNSFCSFTLVSVFLAHSSPVWGLNYRSLILCSNRITSSSKGFCEY